MPDDFTGHAHSGYYVWVRNQGTMLLHSKFMEESQRRFLCSTEEPVRTYTTGSVFALFKEAGRDYEAVTDQVLPPSWASGPTRPRDYPDRLKRSGAQLQEFFDYYYSTGTGGPFTGWTPEIEALGRQWLRRSGRALPDLPPTGSVYPLYIYNETTGHHDRLNEPLPCSVMDKIGKASLDLERGPQLPAMYLENYMSPGANYNMPDGHNRGPGYATVQHSQRGDRRGTSGSNRSRPSHTARHSRGHHQQDETSSYPSSNPGYDYQLCTPGFQSGAVDDDDAPSPWHEEEDQPSH